MLEGCVLAVQIRGMAWRQCLDGIFHTVSSSVQRLNTTERDEVFTRGRRTLHDAAVTRGTVYPTTPCHVSPCRNLEGVVQASVLHGVVVRTVVLIRS